MTRSFDVFFTVHQNKRLSKQSKRRWFATPWRSLWHHSNGLGESSYTLNHGYAIMVMHYGLKRGVGIYIYFQRPLTVPLCSTNGRQMPVIRAVQGECEIVYLHYMPPEVVAHWRRTSGWCQLGPQHSYIHRNMHIENGNNKQNAITPGLYFTQRAKTLGSTSIRHRSDTFASERSLIGVNPRVLLFWCMSCSVNPSISYVDAAGAKTKSI